MTTLEYDLERDPLRVLETTLLVVEAAESVRIATDNIGRVAQLIRDAPANAPDWVGDGHPTGRNDAQRANLVLVVDALNFCFWSVPWGARRWQVTYEGQTHDGYWGLVAALRRAVDGGRPLWDAEHLATLTESDISEILAGDRGGEEIPLIHARLQHLHEAGHALRVHWDGSFLNAVRVANGSAPALVREVVRAMPSFRDVAPWNRRLIRFYKRAQILIADLSAALGPDGQQTFHDLNTLTAFADYKLPQLLRRHGVLEYAPALAATVAEYRLLPPESAAEIEIRAATIWAVELLRQELATTGEPLASYEIDWALWQAAQSLPPDAEPYHRTLTPYY